LRIVAAGLDAAFLKGIRPSFHFFRNIQKLTTSAHLALLGII
jgi:hypothetical protein